MHLPDDTEITTTRAPVTPSGGHRGAAAARSGHCLAARPPRVRVEHVLHRLSGIEHHLAEIGCRAEAAVIASIRDELVP